LELPLNCGVVSVYSFVKQRLKCNTVKVCNCLFQALLTMVLSIEERVFLVENLWPHVRRILLHQTYLWGAAKSAMYRDRPRALNELK
jgi:hypothetical protein